MTCAFKLALLIAKVSKLSLGVREWNLSFFLVKELAEAWKTRFSSLVPVVQISKSFIKKSQA